MRSLLQRGIVATAIVALGSAVTLAQSKPSFAGKWTMVPDGNTQAGARGGMVAGLGDAVTIAQDDKTLTITRTGTQFGDIRSVYKLDGSDSPNSFSANGTDFQTTSKAKWDAGKLVVNTSMDFNGYAFETSMTLSIDAAGNLIVESSRPDFQGGGSPVVTKTTYKKN